jgi:hypothetical protein
MRHRRYRPYGHMSDPLARSQYQIENWNFNFRLECGVTPLHDVLTAVVLDRVPVRIFRYYTNHDTM